MARMLPTVAALESFTSAAVVRLLVRLLANRLLKPIAGSCRWTPM